MKINKGDRQQMKVGSHWVVVADASKAVIYTRKKLRGPLVQLLVIDNEVSRKRAGELLADKGGRSFDSHGKGRHTMAKEETGPKQQAASAFANRLADFIEQATQSSKCRDFGLIAAPKFLGQLREAMSHGKLIAPTFEIDKNVVNFDAADIDELIERHLYQH